MCTSHKKALQPPHPSEAVVGKFINNLPCQRCIPIYPLRYAISDTPLGKVSGKLSTAGYPKLKGAKHYGLRVLRPGKYVYLFYFKNGRMWTQHYLVTDDGRFASFWWSEKDENDPIPGSHARPDIFGATAYIPAPESRTADTVWVLVSEIMLSHCTLWKIEQDTHQLRSRLATQVKPAQGAKQSHVFPSSQLKELVPELVPALAWTSLSSIASGHPMPWSEIQSRPINGSRINDEMLKALMARIDIQPMALVLHDPIGIASELNHLATRAVQAKTKFAGDNSHKLSSSQLINGYFQQAHPPALKEALDRQKRLVNLAEAQRFPSTYAQKISAYEAPVTLAVEDVTSWAKLAHLDHLLWLAFKIFDFSVIANAKAFEDTVLQCIGALVHSEEGIDELSAHINAPIENSLYWLAMTQGNPDILTRLSNPAKVSKGLFEVLDKYLDSHQGTPTTNAMISLLQAVPSANKGDILIRRLRHVMEMRFDATLILHEISAAQYLQFIQELQNYQALGPDVLQRWNGIFDTTVTSDAIGMRVNVYEWVKIGEFEYHAVNGTHIERPALPATQPVLPEGNPLINGLKRLKEPMGHLFVGIGGLLAVVGMWQTVQAAKKSDFDSASLAALLGGVGALIGTGIEVTSAYVAFTATKNGNQALANTARYVAARHGVAIFGAGAAALFAISDGIKAVNSVNNGNPEQAKWYWGAALAGIILTGATYAGGIATAATITTGATVTVGWAGPIGWAVIGLIFLGAVIYFTLKAGEAEHGPIDIWLIHSAWGTHSKHFTQHQELEAFYSLIYRPRLSAKWDQRRLSNTGTLTIRCIFPSFKGGERFAWSISVTLNGRKLTGIEGPINHATGSQPLNYEHQYLIRRNKQMEPESDWTISMHEDAKVSLEYLYQPNPQEQPTLKLTQSTSPTPLIFTASGWFSETIDDKQIAPVSPPK
ncbi:toxin VasX [Pseudomonas sp. GW456-12-1-14-TSB6]|uniref:toxin VasX n=1 Tax=Pseudomonas sp. GW456-12-1-14-TSB6 TaxID=2751350 RepID=UPI0011AEE69E|nr:toxin VasX [Pseudomonas sp. GW456-12-1-14-TSB6]